jgi:hypothetical protein
MAAESLKAQISGGKAAFFCQYVKPASVYYDAPRDNAFQINKATRWGVAGTTGSVLLRAADAVSGAAWALEWPSV